jgi:hypothetical protein
MPLEYALSTNQRPVRARPPKLSEGKATRNLPKTRHGGISEKTIRLKNNILCGELKMQSNHAQFTMCQQIYPVFICMQKISPVHLMVKKCATFQKKFTPHLNHYLKSSLSFA